MFYDGPPFPTGKPHHGTVLVSFIKDMISRYHTMQGYSVPRQWGWDCHGLPIEVLAENALGITNKTDIENVIGYVDKHRTYESNSDQTNFNKAFYVTDKLYEKAYHTFLGLKG